MSFNLLNKVRFGHSEPGAYALSFVAKDESIQHIQITHKPGQNFVLNGVEFASLDEIIGYEVRYLANYNFSIKFMNKNFSILIHQRAIHLGVSHFSFINFTK